MPLITFNTCDLIFYGCPRTGTTTIRELLHQKSIINIWDYKSVPREFTNKVSFTVVRNPFDRFISSWQFALKHNLCDYDDPNIFLDWVLNNDLPYAGANWDVIKTDQRLYAKRHTVPMTSNCFVLNNANYVFKFEDFDTVCQQLCKMANIKYHPIHVNATVHQPYSYYYTKYPKLEENVIKYFEPDFIKYNYCMQVV